MKNDFKWLFKSHLKNILTKWLHQKGLTPEWYQNHVHSIDVETNQLVEKNLTKAISTYEKYYLKNPFISIKEYFSINFDISKFSQRWNKQIKY